MLTLDKNAITKNDTNAPYEKLVCSKINMYCSRANGMSMSHKSPATVVALTEPKHINGLVADIYSHFCDDIPDGTDRIVPIQWSNNYDLELAVGQRCNARSS